MLKKEMCSVNGDGSLCCSLCMWVFLKKKKLCKRCVFPMCSALDIVVMIAEQWPSYVDDDSVLRLATQ